MKALSVKQPWAELIADGSKPLEIRSQPTKYRGPLAIHASLRYDGTAEAGPAIDRLGLLSAKHLPSGRVVAVVDLDACRPFVPDDAAKACRPWIPDRWAGVLSKPRRVDSVLPIKGRLGLWDLPEGLLQEAQA